MSYPAISEGVPSLGRSRGLVVGAAVGDCLGRPFEGHARVPDNHLDDLLARPGILRYTDDTAMTIALIESLLERDGFDGQHMAERFAHLWAAEPDRGYGVSVVEVFAKVRRGVPWDHAAGAQFGGEGSHGNGGAMRVAPVALWGHPDLDAIIGLARTTSSVTHTHPIGIEGAVVQAVAAHHALAGDRLDAGGLLDDLARIVETETFTSKLDVLGVALGKQDDDWARLHLGNWVAADKSVLTALYAFLSEPDFEGTIRHAIGMGGDTDTIAAMAGALAGAWDGINAIPAVWLERIEGLDYLIQLADSLHSRWAAGSVDPGTRPGLS